MTYAPTQFRVHSNFPFIVQIMFFQSAFPIMANFNSVIEISSYIQFFQALKQGWGLGNWQSTAGHIYLKFVNFALKIRNAKSQIYKPFILTYFLP